MMTKWIRQIAPLATAVLICSCSSYDADHYPLAVQRADLADLDLDGVINHRDGCDATTSGALVNNRGCATEFDRTVITPSVVFFDNDDDVIRSDQLPAIEDAADRLMNGATATLVGHTSALASAQYNLALSKRRVENVKKALVDTGVQNSSLSSDYVGESQLKFTGDDDVSHAKNRRVEIQFTQHQNQPLMRWTIYSVENP
ncbi:OmpA family protein [Ferrimonas aestuarii]|uniref:OmpA family protein n=1 Tax=Ferrimonas aestuarii TaxID=2569539 RepID=A0A4U1BTZ5_9GAMM|nr:OmpA family protein [Ferrimonas aestuarii]TKB57428.1 OmpA family protein [Ferrimonas aestuarii]